MNLDSFFSKADNTIEKPQNIEHRVSKSSKHTNWYTVQTMARQEKRAQVWIDDQLLKLTGHGIQDYMIPESETNGKMKTLGILFIKAENLSALNENFTQKQMTQYGIRNVSCPTDREVYNTMINSGISTDIFKEGDNVMLKDQPTLVYKIIAISNRKVKLLLSLFHDEQITECEITDIIKAEN